MGHDHPGGERPRRFSLLVFWVSILVVHVQSAEAVLHKPVTHLVMDMGQLHKHRNRTITGGGDRLVSKQADPQKLGISACVRET